MRERFRAPESVAVQELDGELVLLELERGTFFVARGTGPAVWRLLATGRSIDEVAAEVSDRYGIARDDARHDVSSFVSALRENGLLEPAGDESEPRG